jgi:hypothetical protein
MKKKQISKVLLSRAVPHVHVALENLLRAWDALREVEKLVDFEITTGELSDLAGGLDQPEDVRELMTPGRIQEWLTDIGTAAK